MGTEMELRHLRYFVAVAETESLSLAAKSKLHTSQPSLSRQLRDLEEEIGAQLLTRTARGVALTPAGRAFLDHARGVLLQVDAAAEAARRVVHQADHVTMGMSLIVSARGVGLLPAYAQNFLFSSVTSRPLKGIAPTVDLVLGYRKSNQSPILKLFLSRLDELVARVSKKAR